MNQKEKFTPGPWKVFNATDIFPAHAPGPQIANCDPTDAPHGSAFDEAKANARLISLAPDMYELVKFLARVKPVSKLDWNYAIRQAEQIMLNIERNDE